MAEGFRFMPLGLVRLRTFGSVHGLLRCNINTGVYMHARSGRVTQRCHNSPDGKRGKKVQMTSRTGSAQRILGFWKSQLVELSPATGEDGWLSLPRRSQASRLWGRCRTRWGGQMKKSEEKECVSLSLCWRTFKLKGNKKFRTWPELRRYYVFFVFRDSYVLCIYVMNIMNVLRTRINLSIPCIRIWLWYIGTNDFAVNLITRFLLGVKYEWLILCQLVGESCTLYVYINILGEVFLKMFFIRVK